MSWIRELLPVWAACVVCGRKGSLYCGPCAERAPTRRTARGLLVRSVGLYEGRLAERIKQLKYAQTTAHARSLGRALSALLDTELRSQRPILLPIPLHPLRLVERGYNQSALLARHTAKVHGLPVETRLIERSAATSVQARLSQRQRERNVASAFRVRSLRANDAAPLVLVDDVVTTGSTLDACAEALRAAGLSPALALCVANKA